jgi:collagenase-like PrtC family protease
MRKMRKANKMDLQFNIGFNGRIEDLRVLLDKSDKIGSVYTGGISDKIRGGRPQYIDNLDILSQQVQMAHDRDVSFEIALNAPCGFKEKTDKTWWQAIKQYILDLYHCGVDSIIVSDRFLMGVVKAAAPMKVVASTICEISTVRSALYYEQLGADVIIPSMNVNYEPDILELMAKHLKKARLRIMLNEHCLGDCPWRRFHHNHYAHSHREMDYHLNCKKHFLKNPYLMLTNNAIRPEDVTHYLKITRDFKIVGRLVPIENLLMRIEAYHSGHFEGNFVSLIDAHLSQYWEIPNAGLTDLYQQKKKCNKICETCNFCIQLFNRIGKKLARRP